MEEKYEESVCAFLTVVSAVSALTFEKTVNHTVCFCSSFPLPLPLVLCLSAAKEEEEEPVPFDQASPSGLPRSTWSMHWLSGDGDLGASGSAQNAVLCLISLCEQLTRGP